MCRLNLPVPCISESWTEIKIKLNFYFHTSLWCLKRFYEGLKGLNLFSSSGIGVERVNLRLVSRRLEFLHLFTLLKFIGSKCNLCLYLWILYLIIPYTFLVSFY